MSRPQAKAANAVASAARSQVRAAAGGEATGRPIAVVFDRVMMGHALAAALDARGFECHVLDTDQPIPLQALACGAQAVLVDVERRDDAVAGLGVIEPLVDLGLAPIVLTSITERLVLADMIMRGAAGVVPTERDLDTLVAVLGARARSEAVMPDATERMALINELLGHRREVARARRPFGFLTAREGEVLAGLMAGETPAEMAKVQYVSISTVRSHVKSIMRKLGVSSQLKAVALAHEVGWTPGGDAAVGDDAV